MRAASVPLEGSPGCGPRLAASLVVVLFGLAAACASPTERTNAQAARMGLTRSEVAGGEFTHVVYRPGDGKEVSPSARGPVHVYLGGDGSPRRALRWLPPDPTPDLPIALRLMALDPAPRLFLGRPCYHGPRRSPACHPRDWSTGRYGDAVVESLVQALRTSSVTHHPDGVVLVGYSGGGALAMLMAERMPEVRAVVTVAGNLDPGAWSERHGYTPLADSLDPARRPPLDPRIVQLHVVGERDENVPPELVAAALERQSGSRVLRVADADHACCWEGVWPRVLAELATLLPEPR